jgi:hypothetical protein
LESYQIGCSKDLSITLRRIFFDIMNYPGKAQGEYICEYVVIDLYIAESLKLCRKVYYNFATQHPRSTYYFVGSTLEEIHKNAISLL